MTDDPPGPAVAVRNLTKRFGRLTAVDGVDLTVPRGSVYGFLGPNGSGKTTTIGMILGLLHPTEGSVEVLGEPVSPSRTSVLRRVGSLVGATPAFVPYLTARDNLQLLERLGSGSTPTRIDEVLRLVHLTEAADRRVRSYSTGMKQRLGVASALLHHPELLVLDEPTNGLDPAGMAEIRELVQDLAAAGTTVFISSHLLHEIELVCDTVAIMNAGRVVAEGPVAQFAGASRPRNRRSDLEAVFLRLTGESR